MLSYDDLYRLYLDCKKENEALKTEIEKLRNGLDKSDLSISLPDMPTVSVGINQNSSADEKISLFRSLFCGREDVFARRWQSTTGNKSGYQPVCQNEWSVGLCDKKTFKCSVCPNRILMPLSERDLYNHLKGDDPLCRDVLGIYPMLSDETCYFLCADFDEEAFQDDVAAYREVCSQLEIDVAIERSRSGKGAHAWLFFETAVPASLARKIGSGILTRAMERRGSFFSNPMTDFCQIRIRCRRGDLEIWLLCRCKVRQEKAEIAYLLTTILFHIKINGHISVVFKKFLPMQ